MDIPPEYFKPSPRVISSMIKLVPIKDNQINEFNILIFRFMFYYRDKKVRNALMEALIRSFEVINNPITKRISKDIISNLEIGDELLNKLFSTCSNEELAYLNNKFKKLKVKGDKQMMNLAVEAARKTMNENIGEIFGLKIFRKVLI